MRALVTGAAGFIGSHVAERLLARGAEVRAVDALVPYYDVERKRGHLELLAGAGAEVIVGDVAEDPTALVEGCDVVVHLAAQPGVRASWADFDSYERHNVVATHRLLEALRAQGIDRLVLASTSSVYGDAEAFPTTEDATPLPRSPYGVTKLAAEHLAMVYSRVFGLSVVALRYFSVYGPRQRPDMAMHRLIEAALGGPSFPCYGDGGQIREFTYIGDVVDATVRATTAPVTSGTVLNVAGGESASLRDVIDRVEALVGSPVALDQHPDAPGDVRRTAGSIERIGEVLGWVPATSLDDGLAAQLAWHRSLRTGGV